MKEMILIIIVSLVPLLSACGQDNWHKTVGESTIPGGKTISIRYEMPSDSSSVHAAIVSDDASYCYGGYTVTDSFPPQPIFRATVRWHGCESSDDIVADSTGFVYRGKERLFEFDGEAYPAEPRSLFVITYRGYGESSIREVSDEADLEDFPRATAAELMQLLREKGK